MPEQAHTSSTAPKPAAPGRGGEKPPDESAPEYETVRWKHQVEAEARHDLKREIRGVGDRSR